MSDNEKVTHSLHSGDNRFYSNSSLFPESSNTEYSSDGSNTNSISRNNDIFGFGHSLWFFINERRAHYAELDKEVFNRLTHLKYSVNENITIGALPLRIPFPTKSIHYDNAKLHMLKYSKELPSRIQQLESDLKKYNDEVQKFIQSIDPTIKEAFVISSTAIDRTSYKFHERHVREMVVSVWDENIKDIQRGENIKIFHARVSGFANDNKRLKLDIENGMLRWASSPVLAEGDEPTLRAITDILKEKILKNEKILRSLLELVLSKASLVARINDVSATGTEISNTIQTETFKKAKCCPTLFSLIDKYIL